MSTQPIDYDALAEQARKSAAARVDYDALAAQVRSGANKGLHPTPENPDPNQAGMKPLGTMGQIRNAFSSPAAYAQAVKQNFGQIPKFASAVAEDVKGAATSPSTYLGPVIGGGIDAVKQLYQAAKDGHFQAEPEFLDRIGGALGINTQGVREAAEKGDLAGVVGHAALPVTGAVAATENKPAQRVAAQIAEAVPSPRGAMEAVENLRPQGPQAKVMPSAAKLPIQAQEGVEHFFRASAPTGMNQEFRENLNVAAPDLADIGRKIDVSEAKGGIINPDMRVRASVDAINSHLQEMYQQERAPQIQRNAGAPVNMDLGSDTAEGLKYLRRSAGESEVRAIAAKALEEQTLTVQEADKLAMVANQNLKGFESMTAAERSSASQINRKMSSLKALDKGLGYSLNDVLISNGEEGLRGYERRFAALSEVRDQLSTRMNATELKQPGVFKSIVKPIGAAVTGGASGIASASQAAVADVNIGKMLQSGFKKLADSGITAKRGPALSASQ